jgi:hypothetical protein
MRWQRAQEAVMNLAPRASFVLVAALAWLPASAARGSPIVGQVDTFEDGTTQGWLINLLGMNPPPPEALPANISTGGPGGADDNYLQLTSLGGTGAGSRLSVLNLDARWTGDYLAAGINAITMDLINLGINDLALRLVFEDPTVGPPTNVAFSTDAVLLPAGGGWTRVTFLIDPGSLTAGLGDITAALTGTTAIRLYHSPTPNFPNPVFPIPAVVAQLGVDNIRAAAVPEPVTFVLAGISLAGLAAGAIRRRQSATIGTATKPGSRWA